MSARVRRHCAGLAALLFLVLLAPPVKHALEASMTMQMLVQIPLLVGVGLLLRAVLPERAVAVTASWDYGGVSGLLLASFAAAFWALPRSLDAAVTAPMMASLKYLTVPLLIGLPFAVSWPRMSFIVRGVFLLEFIATLFRMGWLYLIWPDRLCNNYLLDDQQRLGQYLVLAGVALCILSGWKLLWGRFDAFAETRRIAPPSSG
ncbi:MAG TPA: hypothetical protein VIE42_00840 [Steroidobacteraceae bacterium]|jgi:hypothetical protein